MDKKRSWSYTNDMQLFLYQKIDAFYIWWPSCFLLLLFINASKLCVGVEASSFWFHLQDVSFGWDCNIPHPFHPFASVLTTQSLATLHGVRMTSKIDALIEGTPSSSTFIRWKERKQLEKQKWYFLIQIDFPMFIFDNVFFKLGPKANIRGQKFHS